MASSDMSANTPPPGDAELRQYLLGELPEEVLERVELRLLEDPATARALAGAEDELIEDYLGDALAEPERERFESYFLASATHRRSLEGARLLRELVPKSRGADTRAPALAERPAPWALLATAAALVAAAAAGLWWLETRPSLPANARVAPLESAPSTRAEEPDPRPPQPREVASLTLAPGRHMGGGDSTPRVRLAPHTTALRLLLIVDDPSLERCRASLSGPDGGELWSQAGLRPSRSSEGATLAVEIPAERLAPASDYKLTLYSEPASARSGSYYFQLQR